MSEKAPGQHTAAATDIAEFISDLDGGIFERALSVALSQSSAAVIDMGKKAKVTITLDIERIESTHQVRVAHVLKFVRPTSNGRAGEETTGATVLHVGQYGALSLAQPSLLEKARQTNLPT